MPHVVLLGDSIFDNAAYVPGQPDVIRQLRARLPAGWQATLGAIDGDVTTGVEGQLRRAPPDATHLVVSVGGNDALRHVSVLDEPLRSMGEALTRLSDLTGGFERQYRAMLDAVLSRNLPTAICTIYNPRFPDPRMQRLAVTALVHFNDVIIRAAFTRGLPLLDLRLICDEDTDYANPIEPSARGGEKISAAIAGVLLDHDFPKGRTAAFTR